MRDPFAGCSSSWAALRSHLYDERGSFIGDKKPDIESEYTRFEYWSTKWWALGNRNNTALSWVAVSSLLRGAATMTISTAVELDAHFLADLARTRGGL